MNTPKSNALAVAKMSRRCWTVLFSVTLAPTLSQFFPAGLRTSFWGSMTTTAVSLVIESSRVGSSGGESGIDVPGDHHWLLLV